MLIYSIRLKVIIYERHGIVGGHCRRRRRREIKGWRGVFSRWIRAHWSLSKVFWKVSVIIQSYHPKQVVRDISYLFAWGILNLYTMFIPRGTTINNLTRPQSNFPVSFCCVSQVITYLRRQKELQCSLFKFKLHQKRYIVTHMQSDFSCKRSGFGKVGEVF